MMIARNPRGFCANSHSGDLQNLNCFEMWSKQIMCATLSQYAYHIVKSIRAADSKEINKKNATKAASWC